MHRSDGNRKFKPRLLLFSGLSLLVALILLSCSAVLPFVQKRDMESGLIAYIGVDGNIYTINGNGTNPSALTNDSRLSTFSEQNNRFYQFPAWSPDGSRVAFVGLSQKKGHDQEFSIFTAAPDGSDRVEVFKDENETPFYLYWSPDSTQLSFLTAGGNENDLALRLVPARGGEAQVVEIGAPIYWAWSPDNSKILIHTGGAWKYQPKARVALLDMTGKADGALLSLHPSFFQAPDWSSDGDQLLLAAETEAGKGDLLLTDSEGQVKESIAHVDGSIAFSWSPDSKYLAYSVGKMVNPEGSYKRLTVLDPEHPERAITLPENLVLGFFWSPDSRKLAYFVPDVSVRGSEDVSTRQQVQKRVLLQLRILDVNSGDVRQVGKFRPTNEFISILPFFDQYQRSATIWSPDSQKLVLSGKDEQENPKIYVAAASGNSPIQEIADGYLAFWSWK